MVLYFFIKREQNGGIIARWRELYYVLKIQKYIYIIIQNLLGNHKTTQIQKKKSLYLRHEQNVIRVLN